MARTPNRADMTPFMFERSFDDPDAVFKSPRQLAEETAAAEAGADETSEEDVVEVVFSETEMAAAKQDSYMDGHADGFREGHAEAMETLNKSLNDLLERLAPMIADLGTQQAESNERAQANMARIVKELIGKLMPVYLREHGAEEALQVVSDCLGELQDPGRLTIRLSEPSADLLGDRLAKVAERTGFEGSVRLLTDPDMGPSDVRVDWGAGGAERSYDSIRDEIDAAIDRAVEKAEAGLSPPPEAGPPPQAETPLAETALEEHTPEPGVVEPAVDAIALQETPQEMSQETPGNAPMEGPIDGQADTPPTPQPSPASAEEVDE